MVGQAVGHGAKKELDLFERQLLQVVWKTLFQPAVAVSGPLKKAPKAKMPMRCADRFMGVRFLLFVEKTKQGQ